MGTGNATIGFANAVAGANGDHAISTRCDVRPLRHIASSVLAGAELN